MVTDGVDIGMCVQVCNYNIDIVLQINKIESLVSISLFEIAITFHNDRHDQALNNQGISNWIFEALHRNYSNSVVVITMNITKLGKNGKDSLGEGGHRQ